MGIGSLEQVDTDTDTGENLNFFDIREKIELMKKILIRMTDVKVMSLVSREPQVYSLSIPTSSPVP